jgi:orotate phosphoribosyltransferase
VRVVKERREELLELIRDRSLEFGDFTLTSGKKSKYYIDARLTTLDPLGAFLIGNVILDVLDEKKIHPDAVGGLSLGADPISTAVSLVSHTRNRPIRALMVRKEAKGHGTRKRVEGVLHAGDEVVVVEDVISTGGSTMTAIEALESEGARVALVVAIVDRLMGGREALESKGFPVEVLFTIRDILGDRWESVRD